MDFLKLLLVLALAALGIYVLAILLRVACHLCGVEVPGLGRAMFATLAVVGLSVLALLGLQMLLVNSDSDEIHPAAAIALIVLGLPSHMAVAVGVYRLLLGARLGLAFRVWAVQAAVFIGFALISGCCLGGLSRL